MNNGVFWEKLWDVLWLSQMSQIKSNFIDPHFNILDQTYNVRVEIGYVIDPVAICLEKKII